MNSLYILMVLQYFFISPQLSIKWLTPRYQDVGIIAYNQPHIFMFEFEVIGKDSVIIDNIRTDCSCTASDWQPDEVPIAPQTRRQLRITYDAHRKGFFEKKIVVWLRNERKPEKLYIKGEVR